LTNHGWKINTVWVPSHCDIEGNESADKLAKLGTDHTLTCCPMSYTSFAWMNRIAQSTFVTRWRQEIGMPDIKISHGNIQLNGNGGLIEWLGQFFECIVVELRLTLVMNMKQRSVSVVKQIMLLVTVDYLIN
jgi:hypothetical protein